MSIIYSNRRDEYIDTDYNDENDDVLINPERKIIMRERTENIKLETTYCPKCGGGYKNIGRLKCIYC